MELERGRHYATELVHNALKLDGDLIDLGVANGEQTILLAEEVRKNGSEKIVYACDTFAGFPYTDEGTPVRSDLRVGEFAGNTLESIVKKCEERGVNGTVVPIAGLFEDTLEKELDKKKFCYAFVDANLYKSTLTAYKFLEKRMVKGGIIGFHDYEFYRCPGVTKVIKETIDKKMFKEIFRQRMHIFFQKISNKESKNDNT